MNPYGLTGDLYDEKAGPEYIQQPMMIEPYNNHQIGFGTSINSAIASKVPDDRLLRAEEIYLGQM